MIDLFEGRSRNQIVGIEHQLKDTDILTLVLRR